MKGIHQSDENLAPDFSFFIRVSSYPCFLHQWLFSQEPLSVTELAFAALAYLLRLYA